MEKGRKWQVISGVGRRWWLPTRGSPGLGEADGWVILEERREREIRELRRDEERERWNDFESGREL